MTLWDAARLSAPFRRSSRSGDPAVSASALIEDNLACVADIPDLGATLATVILVRESARDSARAGEGSDWLDLCLPLGALANLDNRVGAYPLGDVSDSSRWRRPIESWFEGIATAVFDAVPFVYAVTGNEVSGLEPSEQTSGNVGLFAPDANGNLAIRPVTSWNW